MRALSIIVALALAPALVAQAQSPEFEEEFVDIEAAHEGPPRMGVWEFDDGIDAAEVPWDDFDESSAYLPRGDFHFGLEGRISGLFTETQYTDRRPQIEAHAFLDARYGWRSPFHMRVGLVFGWEPHRSQHLGGGTVVTTSAAYIRLRILPLSVDLGRNFGVRLGGDIGVQIAPTEDGAMALFSAAALTQFVCRSDDGRLEVGVHFGIQLSGAGRATRPNAASAQSNESYFADPVIGLTGGYVF